MVIGFLENTYRIFRKYMYSLSESGNSCIYCKIVSQIPFSLHMGKHVKQISVKKIPKKLYINEPVTLNPILYVLSLRVLLVRTECLYKPGRDGGIHSREYNPAYFKGVIIPGHPHLLSIMQKYAADTL